jgi:hypothetical protein
VCEEDKAIAWRLCSASSISTGLLRKVQENKCNSRHCSILRRYSMSSTTRIRQTLNTPELLGDLVGSNG